MLPAPRDLAPSDPFPNPPGRRSPEDVAAAVPAAFPSQNQIEEELVGDLVALVSLALQGITVADRGFARASFFRFHQARTRFFVIRFDAQTHIRLPAPLAPNRPAEGLPAAVLGLRPDAQVWCPEAVYGAEDQVPISLLGVWDAGQAEPWYLATNLPRAEPTEVAYRWRMRLECSNRDEKTGVILRAGGDNHALESVLHLHRLLLALGAVEWLCALVGLQALDDLPQATSAPLPAPAPVGALADLSDPAALAHGPAVPPPVVPHRGARPKPPAWLKRFVAWGPLSSVRLGWEVLAASDLRTVVQRLTRWLAAYLWSWIPLWCPHQLRYRLHAWWTDSS